MATGKTVVIFLCHEIGEMMIKIQVSQKNIQEMIHFNAKY